jgi:predicted  nucleic acid-binding Zn-ribbon protein
LADAQAQFTIDLKGDLRSQSKEASSALSELRDKIKGNQSEIDGYKSALKALKGSSDEVKAAQAELKTKLDAAKKSLEENKVSAQHLKDKLNELRAASRQQAAAAREQKEHSEKLTRAMQMAGGPVAKMASLTNTYKEAMKTGYGPQIMMVGGVVAFTAACVAAMVAIIGTTVAFFKWTVGTADAARSLNLLQEAAAGSAENSAAMTSQIDAMARKVPTARDELQKLYQETYRLNNHTTMSGQAIQSTYEAIAQSSAAMGDEVGKQIGDLITRSKMLGVIRIGRMDVQGTGLDYEKDFVEPLAKAMNKAGPITAEAMNKARAQLAIGGLKMEAGAQFVADAVNKRFGDINMRQMLSLGVMWTKLKETFVSFTRSINLDPLLKAVQHFFDMFKGENDVGTALKNIIDILGNQMVDSISKSGPKVEDFIKQLMADIENFTIDCLEGKDSLMDMFKVKPDDMLTNLKEVLELAKDLLKVLGAINKAREGVATIIAGAASLPGAAHASDLQDQAKAYAAAAKARQEAGGVKSGYKPHEAPASYPAVPTPANSGPPVLAPTSSPPHAEGGIVGAPAPGEFWASVAPGEQIVPAGASPGGGGGGITIQTLNVNIEAKGGTGKEIAQGLVEESFLEKLTHTFEVALGNIGIGVQEPT